MDIIIRIIQVIFALSLLVLVHEFGHFLFARIFKIRVEKFYLFFPPAIFKFKPKNCDTEFGIGSIPLGGFCKISGMIDESMDKDAMSKPPQPWEFRSKPAWQRLLVLIGGVLFNFIFAMVLYSAILFAWGEEYLKNDNAIYGVEVNDLAHEIGFRDGDKIIAFDDVRPNSFFELQIDLVRSQAEKATILRGTDTMILDIDPAYIPALLNTPGIFTLRTPMAIAAVTDTSQNITSGLLAGDVFTGINSTPIMFQPELREELEKLKNQTAIVEVKREGEIVAIPVIIDENGNLGVLLRPDISEFSITSETYSLVSSIPAGIKKAVNTVGNYIKELGLMFSPETEAYKSVGSFIAIGSIFPTSWNWQIFWNITAWLSIMLAVINLLPIPALDGGHIVFTLYEIITRRKPSDKFLEYAQVIGLLILFTLIFFAFGNDIYRLFK